MSREVAEWIGATPDTPVPPRVRARVFLRFDGRCHACTRKVRPGEPWTCEHLTALINARPGENLNRESNLGVTCENCLPAKNAADVAEKSIIARKRAKHLGTYRRTGRPLAGTKASGIRKRMSGEVERW